MLLTEIFAFLILISDGPQVHNNYNTKKTSYSLYITYKRIHEMSETGE